MNKVIFFLCILSLEIKADKFTDALTHQTSKKNESYYRLLPQVNEETPDICFIRTREPESMSLEDSFLAMIENACPRINFIETGFYHGDTTLKASKRFRVYAIELSEVLCEKAKQRFKNTKNINLYQGDTIQVLPTILKSLKEQTVIFLDAHYSMGETAKGSSNTPIIEELEIIKKSSHKNALLIIDDARMFYKPITNVKETFMEGYPTLNDIVDKILEINPNYQCAVVYDTLVAFPAQENITVSPLVRALTMSRLYDGTNYDIYDVLEAELCIAHAKEKERETLIDLATCWIEKWSEQAGLSRHYDLWYGLILMTNEEYGKALAYFQEGKKRGLNDWRIDWYIAMAQAQCFFGIR